MTNHQIVTAMSILGGSFASALAQAWFAADDVYRQRIQDAFPDLWAHYTELAEMRQQRQQVTHE